MTTEFERFTALAPARAAPIHLRLWPLLRQCVPLMLGLACLWLLAGNLDDFDVTALQSAFRGISPAGWALAALATGVSFWAVGRYDVVVHRHLRSGVDDRDAALAGVASIALAQTVGLGVITGALARWRALPRSSLKQCSQISALVAVSFLLGWSVVTALAALVLPLVTPMTAPLPDLALPWIYLPLLLAPLLAALALWRPVLTLPGGAQLALPSLAAMGHILWLTFIDTLAACIALYVLLPAEASVALSTLYPVFLLALGVALVSGTPGGVGPFELMLLTLLPQTPEPALLAAVLAFRLVYYALPAALATLYLLATPAPRARTRRGHPGPMSALTRRRPGPRLLAHATRSELGVARQNGGRLFASDKASGVTVETGQTLTLLFDPARGTMTDLLPLLGRAAKSINRVPVIYKCSAQSALAARQSGFALWHVADEAVIDPTRFDLSARPLRQLRRKLRQAERAGVTTTRAAHLPRAEMARIDAEWRARQGAARGLTMGRFDHDYLSHHLVFLAWKGDQLQGFATLHSSAHELCLDVMRSADAAPHGTMHALVACAIAHAARHNRRRLSLASVPALSPGCGPLEQRLRSAVFRAANGPGLLQFKSSFAPRYEPLYMAAPSRLSLLLGAADLALAVRRPLRLMTMMNNIGLHHSPKCDT
ncbi:phosphatidylglycerol lysyltransferase domain-containing protein [Rhodobacteraceae bacterium D3-12]|nr:phosphatidylglycerol lysyltransferase domain-containing protein [Rhodobacteraceae bacterium D3-12]